MDSTDYGVRYEKHLRQLVAAHGRDRAMELVVGGEYAATGILERNVLIATGLQPEHSVVDVGCGSGRLGWALRDFLRGRYVGTDLLADALAFAREKVDRDDWRYLVTEPTKIPVDDASADFVCFFSVFTHVLHEDAFLLLREARRCCRAGGRIVISFLDYEMLAHWRLFEQTLADRRPDRVLNTLVTKPILQRWAAALDLEVERLTDGDAAWIPVDPNFTYEDGRRAHGVAAFGQSIAVLRKRAG
jgi:SAM-dependent methyltransferase